jgi:perosamine synthetase
MFATSLSSANGFTDESLHSEIADSVGRLLASGQWASYHAAILEELKTEIKNRLGASNVRLCASGSVAIELALRGCGLKAGDEVICPALDYPGNIRAIRLVNASPVIVDVAKNGWTIDAALLSEAASSRTRAVLASHLYGEIADVGSLRTTCDERGWILIEDVCQMPGGSIGNLPLGSFGHVAAFSFGGSKPITAGSGGAIVTNDDRIAQRITSYIDRPSELSPLSPLQAAVLLPQWKRLDELIDGHIKAVGRLINVCRDSTPHWRMPNIDVKNHRSCFYKIPIRLKKCEDDEARLKDIPQRIIHSLLEARLSAGVPFRVIEQVASGRGRMFNHQNASEIASTCFLLDHRNLVGASENMKKVAELLISVHDRSKKFV